MTICLVAGICVGSVWSHILEDLSCDCNWLVGRCSSVGERLGLERALGVGSYCSSGLVQQDGGLGLNGHHLGILGCSIFHHKIHHRIGSRCHIGRRSCVEIALADIVAEQVVEWAVVALVGRLASDPRWLGI